MALSNKAPLFESAAASDIARFGVTAQQQRQERRRTGRISVEQTDAHLKQDRKRMRRRVLLWAIVVIPLFVVSCGICGPGNTMGAAVIAPWEAAEILGHRALQLLHLTPDFGEGDLEAMQIQVTVITVIAAVLLGVSGMLYQTVFKNPIAGPGMLGATSGVSLGYAVLVLVLGGEAIGALGARYAICYGSGLLILALVILAGKRLSAPGRPFDVVTMLLVGSILGQLLGFVTTYISMFVLDSALYSVFYELTGMMQVDTSFLAWLILGVVSIATLAPVIFLRFRMNMLSYEQDEARLMGVNMLPLRTVALVCGAIMMLAAQVHIGSVAMVTLFVPFIARSMFGCEFRHQLVGCICVGTVLLLLCRDLSNLIPFVGEGVPIGVVTSMVALPIFLFLMMRHVRGWE